jgi:dTDP-glucose 4,6-dehydratase/UDP-glucuronate decarboxylase
MDPFAHSRILLTGASGLIGSYFAHLFHYLNEERGFDIEVDLITRSETTKGSRIYDLVGAKKFNFIQKDLSQYTVYKEKYDYVIHAAGYGAPAAFLENALRTIDVNYIGLKSILESCLATNPATKILYLSSSEIYGSPTIFPTPETYPGNSPTTSNRACYIESKRLSEVLALNYISLRNAYIKIARPALTYGPGMSFDDKRVISQFIQKAHSEKEIRMIDDGRDLRCFCYMSDALRQLVNILLYGKDAIYNVGSSQEEVSIKQLADMIGELAGAQVIAGPGKTAAVAAAPSRVCLDMSKLEKEFGFTPSVRMKEGLKNTIEWSIARS